MTIYPCIVGIDVSKSTLDIFDAASGKSSRQANASEPIMGLARQWREAGAFVVFEATGRYDETLRRVLSETGVAFKRMSPDKARSFAQFAGYLAKTDKLDARMLAELGKTRSLEPDPPFDEDREALAALQQRRNQLVLAQKQERTRQKGVIGKAERESIGRHLDFLAAEIATIEGLIKRHIASCQKLKAARRLLLAIPGIGEVNAVTLLALLPELGQRSAKTIAALVGLAPLNRDSGTHRGKRSIRGGRKTIRDKLYMAAVSAAKSNSHLGDFYRSLIEAGKPHKVAFIALARKILLTANAIIRTQTNFVLKTNSKPA